ncbi:MAG: tetratricopeptide repeat protein [Candidatus Heimdallarchaeota archaeon]|nr:tetratricopeptide repeat protein [Candidatus Heimdallarchaeota archaeon]
MYNDLLDNLLPLEDGEIVNISDIANKMGMTVAESEDLLKQILKDHNIGSLNVFKGIFKRKYENDFDTLFTNLVESQREFDEIDDLIQNAEVKERLVSNTRKIMDAIGSFIGIADNSWENIDVSNLNYEQREQIHKVVELLSTGKQESGKQEVLGDENIWYRLGLISQKLGWREEAVIFYSTALKHKIDFVLAWNNMGNVYADNLQYDEAIEAYNNALLIQPDHTNVLNNLGFVMANLGRFEESEEAYRKAIESDPENEGALNNLANLVSDLGRNDEAKEWYLKAVQTNPNDVSPWYNLGLLYFSTEEYRKSEEAFREVLKVIPEHTSTWNNLGYLFSFLKRYDEAEQALKRAINIEPRHAGAHKNLGNLYNDMNRLQEAISYWEKAISLDPYLEEELSVLIETARNKL